MIVGLALSISTYLWIEFRLFHYTKLFITLVYTVIISVKTTEQENSREAIQARVICNFFNIQNLCNKLRKNIK